MKLQILIRIWK